jgi:hypothetical protein
MKHPLAASLCFCAIALTTLNAHAGLDPNSFFFSVIGMFPNYHWSVSNATINGGVAQANPTLFLIRGQTYSFNVTGLAGIHSFYINTVPGIVPNNVAYTGGGLSANGITTNTPVGTPITFTVPQDAPDTLYYDCGVHISMEGTINIDGIFANGFEAQ